MSASTRSSGVPKRWQRTAFMGQESLEIVSEAHSGGGTARRGMPYDSRAMYIIARGQLGRFAFTLPNSASSSRYSRFAAWRAGTLPGGRPMSAIRYAVLILVTSLASVAFAQQPPKPAASAAAPATPAGDAQPTLLGQYGDWGAYTASPGGNKVCFALAKPKTTKTEPEGRKRDPPTS